MSGKTLLVQRRLEQFQRDNARVIARYFGPENQGKQSVCQMIDMVMAMEPELRHHEWRANRNRFASRHRDFVSVLRRHFSRLIRWLDHEGDAQRLEKVGGLDEQTQLLIACYMTAEYSVEAAAFFNPSIVPHPVQDGVPPGGLRFIMSFRATGEGHISSVAFRSGILHADCSLMLDPVSAYISTPIIETHRKYDKELFTRKLGELKAWNSFAGQVLLHIPDEFTRDEMEAAFDTVETVTDNSEREHAIHTMRWLADSNYQIYFDDEEELAERVIFPVSQTEAHGIEDARFVRFVDDDGSTCYYATYTAFSGVNYSVQLIETHDFRRFQICTLNGPGVRDKGMALFPRRIGGDYVMLGRQDGRNITISRSRHMHFWYEWHTAIEPQQPWELVKLGNCGSPIETPEGWIVLTHGVGAVRRYCIGAVLLDLNDPLQVIGRLKHPLIEPLENEREGYVPNVVYTCGALAHRDQLLIPYAMSDTRSGLATVAINDLVHELIAEGPGT